MKKYVSIYLSISLIALSLFSLPAFAVDSINIDCIGGILLAQDNTLPIVGVGVLTNTNVTVPTSFGYPDLTFYVSLESLDINTTYQITIDLPTFSDTTINAAFDFGRIKSLTYKNAGTVSGLDIYSVIATSLGLDNVLYSYSNNQLTISFNTINYPELVGTNDYENTFIYFNTGISVKGKKLTTNPSVNVTATYDPNQEYLLELILSELRNLASGLGSSDEYYTNVTEALNNIYNVGSDKIDSIPTNGGELAGAVSDLDQAEQGIYNRSDTLISNVQPQLSGYISSASDNAATLLPVASFVTNIFTRTKDAIPPYVAILFTVIPLLLFVGWLIGRFK